MSTQAPKRATEQAPLQTLGPQSIHFDIGRITLHGYSARDRDRFESALRARLTELAAGQHGAGPAGGNQFIDRLDAGTIPAGASPERAAWLIAARVLGAVGSSAGVARPATVAASAAAASPGGAAHA